jgi:prepilin signal peptidase PulO-like enzyme (type II secretory pathway)
MAAIKALKIRGYVPYIGMPIIVFIILGFSSTEMQPFVLMRHMLVALYGYLAAIIDIRTRKIPNSLIKVMLATWILTIVPLLFTDTQYAIGLLYDSLAGFAVSGGLFLIVYVLSRKGLGGGDVKFMAAAGLFLGYSLSVSAILFGTVLAAVTGGILILCKKINRKDPIPLAPFLFAGILLIIIIA